MTSTDTRTVVTINPATDEPLHHYPVLTDADIEQALAETHATGLMWRRVAVEERARLLGTVADALDARRLELAALVTAEMGKPVAEAAAEVDKCVWQCRQYAEDGASYLQPESIAVPAQSCRLVYEPLGVILAVMPWNFPLWQVFRFAIPALLAGNTVLLKHASNVTGSALAIEAVIEASALPGGVLRTLVVDEADVAAVAERLISDSRVAAVTLTGSTRAGAHVASAAGRALKKSVLELGGSDPFVVLADADIDAAAVHAVKSRFMCSGQTCIAAKRIVVHKDIADRFQKKLVEAVESLTVGDPTDAATTVGPLARPDILEQVQRQVEKSVAQGATVLTGGRRLDRDGNFYAPTVLTDVTHDMPVLAEETFGPVVALIRVDDDDQAVTVANSTEYGLAASVWSRDIEHAVSVGSRIESGVLFVNSLVMSDPRVPFGGIKRSGYGRELGAAGVREFTNLRTIWIAQADA
ncbi:aldehyde dehydrogenase [Mycolicibacterium mageritense DSM 44476 = CIP 104973]|uniref:Succinate-semialdehyde dehydrogenase n=1 Tax=Mycolicibacterium mageritense TaxID=53462 RepID=A0AAI8TUP7_MYCME|nr:NAD-dependent succinate-semialdehyde dehydrogenase [Mycolicibacterium mageritense]MCC9180683.1 NAD-dependent succinate-semialdehyde dehydrogenase [Mycolicibacterium mageritense]TXI61357.1 MAG: NAD-dependent succinate-semialdehyde dehydrogenase [Mycolicibacterium mageritense]CDO23020.1 succinic semialdehyde dehydrogenase [Mycolicibacterium mageritense DSM 44476 = CIP 104973]BBX32439.1 succinate-semialdehyde dehydrogenase [Mycolicibacterium mageritense]BDY28892.1 Succinate-semialdehyde dehydr